MGIRWWIRRRALLETLRRAIARLEEPASVLEYATPASQILVTSPGERTLTVMEAMDRRGFSHIPIIYQSQIQGVFSGEYALFVSAELPA